MATAAKPKPRKLTPKQQTRLAELEGLVEQWWGVTLEAAEALCSIQDEKLYEATHDRFEDYVRERWDKTRQWAYDLANWWRINLIAGTQDDPLSMGAARLLKSVRDDPKVLKKIMTEARKIAKKAGRSVPTAKDVELAKAKLFPPTPRPVKPVESVVGVVKVLQTVDESLRSAKAEDLSPDEMAELKEQMAKMERLIASINEVIASGGAEVGGASPEEVAASEPPQ
jgi:hypothetical protein